MNEKNNAAAMNARAMPRPVPSVRPSFRGVFFFCVVIAVLMVIVYGNMKLSGINQQYRSLSNELSRLQTEEGRILRNMEANLNLSEVEAYAIEELGMVKPTSEQYVYVGSPSEDCAEVIRPEGFLGKMRRVFSAVAVRVVEFWD